VGTSIDLVEAAVREADGGAGVVLIADLGSSVLTAKTLIEDLETDEVVLADAPFVEGAVAAASAAATGAPLADVLTAARDAHNFRKT
jgi:phosphoenolpyruvate---glycerone phosphotransferase subunit DhaM